MRALLFILLASAFMARAQAKAVFAHFMVGNTENYTSSDWADDMLKAKEAHIDAFALNMAYGEAVNENALVAAFSAASAAGLQLFFSFDYAGNGPWPQETVIQYISKYASSGTYFHHNGKPFVSTFEGPDNANDWIDIKAQTGCFFMPDWSSLGAKKAMAAGGGVADGLFSWAAWPWGYWDMWTYSDASYKDYLGGKPYMMPISPWFYTNLPGYNKNWIWRGDHIWGDRWFQAAWWQPEFIEIISWNDYGESHYIGPVREHAMGAFEIGKAPFNYGTLPHDGWRDILPFVIDMYKHNVSSIDYERAVAWYKLVPALVGTKICDRNGTVANTASQLQIEYLPDEVMDDNIFFVALLIKKAKVECVIGGHSVEGKFYQGPEGDGVGMYLGECKPGGHEGSVEVRITRPDLNLQLTGDAISYDCSRWNGFSNFNAYVMSSINPASSPETADDYSDLACVNGTGMPKAAELCEFTCSLDYCPPGACVCTRFGKKPARPKSSGIKGYPLPKLDASFGGLCSFACDAGFCPQDYCTTTQVALPVWPESLFDPPYCTEGKSFDGNFDELCQFTCAHGFCPIGVCRCLATGFLNLLEPNTTSTSDTLGANDYGLCNYACSRGFCPDNICYEDADLIKLGYGPFYDYATEEYFSNGDPGDLSCDSSKAPATLDDLVSTVDSGSIPSICWNQWALNILFSTLVGFADEFAASAKGYDTLFDAYEGWVKDSVGSQLDSFLAVDTGEGNQFFDCVLTISGRKYDKMGCQYLGLDKLPDASWTVDYSLRDADGFYAAALDKLGIEKDWITFGNVELPTTCRDTGSDRPSIGGGSRPCSKLTHKKTNAPVSVAKDKINVPNPKEVIQAATPNMSALADSLMIAQVDLTLQINEADGRDIVTAASMPILMLEQAIRSMDNIKAIGSKILEENKKKLILEILSIVLVAIPFVGEAGGALFGGVAMVSRIAALVDIAGSVGLTAYDIVQDPSSAPFAILGLLVGGFGTGARSEKEAFGEAAKARRGLSASDITKLGDDFADKDQKVQRIVNACLKV
ncbi:alpha-glucanase [Colletotrichum limetticola]|uniref:Alpha-glucanase n=1 Tax=Colletotrichum limetticola TaxID=1209924 RepID=A0ABQ9PDP6_9PEZI|nr:alpha-glucanase [Colletotrichum limetticola]